MPTPLTAISSTAWEHPADRAALNTLRALPGFDEVVRKIAGFFGERGIRQLFLASAVRVGPEQRPRLHAIYNEVLATLDHTGRGPLGPDGRPVPPELYVTQTPFVNAAAVGFDRPFIIVNSGMLELLDERETRVILAHEVGHLMSGHATYNTIAILLLTFGLSNLPFLATVALLPFQLALLEWFRKAEFSADRAALLGCQDRELCMGVFMKLAGGTPDGDEASLEAFMRQAADYETGGNAWDTVLKVLNTAFQTHPFATVRAAELQRWIDGGDYARILAGDYPRRGERDGAQPLVDDFADAAGYYRKQARETLGSFGGMVDRARDAFSDAFRGPGGSSSGGSPGGGSPPGGAPREGGPSSSGPNAGGTSSA